MSKIEEVLNENPCLCNIPYQFIDYANNIDISHLRNGMLFLYADWSGSARTCFRKLIQDMCLMEKYNLFLTILDVDGIDEYFIESNLRTLGYSSNGYGEVFFIKNGAIITQLSSIRSYKTQIEMLLQI